MANKLVVANIATQERVEISNGVFRNGTAYYLSKSEPKVKWCEKYHVKVIGHEEAGAYTKYLLDTEDGWNFIVPVKGAGESKQERKARAPRQEAPKSDMPHPQQAPDSARVVWTHSKSFDGNTIFLVRDGNDYVTFDGDSSLVSDATGIDVRVDGSISFSADMLKRVMSKLIKKGYSVEVVDDEYKGDKSSSSNGNNENADANTESDAKSDGNGSSGTESTDGGSTESESDGDGEPMPEAPKAPAKGAGRTASKKGVEKAEKETEDEAAPQEDDDNIDETAKAIAEALRQARTKSKGGDVDEDAIRKIVRDEFDKLEKSDPVKARKIKAVKEAKDETLHPLFNLVLNMVVNDRAIGRYPWLFGPAGSGKSTLCKQIADHLGLPFYSVSSLQQKYELEGYTDAMGELVQTVFYKAAKEGGIFLFDEASTTSAEVQVAFNSMLANLWYNFPKVGMLTAHPDFHIIAADNTAGWGGDKKYHARFELDASTLDRYTPVAIDYTDKQDMQMARDDKELVAFMKDVRKALDAADLTYTASPRASKAIKAFQEMGLSDKECLTYGLCGGWSQQDVRIIANRVEGTTKYHKAFKSLVK